MEITKETSIKFPDSESTAIAHARKILNRDFVKVFGADFKDGDDIVFDFDKEIKNPEQFVVSISGGKIYIRCTDEMAVVYAALHISREYLGVDNFWFWTEKEPENAERITVPDGEYISPVPRVRYRGWFVNDEVCLIGWSDVYPPSRQVWEIVFETLLRLNGNMVIPGTDLPRSGEHFDIASEMGLYITHHHAEPLGSEMFLRAYPNEEASYDTNAELFHKLWADAIEKNKDKKIVWTLGFRGQGDAPFWMNDPKYVTPQSRAEVIRRVIDKQYEMICDKVENPVCAVYLYGEITELYEGGYLELPKKFIKIWSDNGYGKMVTRRRGTHNPRVPSLPREDGMHGLYYHITFHDLQASSHLTLLGNPPEFVNDELDQAFKAGADDYLLLNCGNIRPHIYMLDLVSRIWLSGKVDIEEFKRDFSDRYFGNAEAIECYNDYFQSCIKYGEYDDDRAGDEIYYHTARRICVDWAKGNEFSEGLVFATGRMPFDEQVAFFEEKCAGAVERFGALVRKCEAVSNALCDSVFFDDNIALQARLHLSGARGLRLLCAARRLFRNGDYPKCFVKLSDSIA
ncbi:MAG: glycosyl hydrolase 115 family protein, partial [Oscillospiraceae bacterium]|nr:glycosyl hydrolase 115 family protein [Oscillospiraceae bacterium]